MGVWRHHQGEAGKAGKLEARKPQTQAQVQKSSGKCKPECDLKPTDLHCMQMT